MNAIPLVGSGNEHLFPFLQLIIITLVFHNYFQVFFSHFLLYAKYINFSWIFVFIHLRFSFSTLLIMHDQDTLPIFGNSIMLQILFNWNNYLKLFHDTLWYNSGTAQIVSSTAWWLSGMHVLWKIMMTLHGVFPFLFGLICHSPNVSSSDLKSCWKYTKILLCTYLFAHWFCIYLLICNIY